jgi:hypothetical protein
LQAKLDFILRFKISAMSASPRSKWRFINRCNQHFSMSNRYADRCCFYRKEGRQVNMSTWDFLFDFNGSSALMSILAIIPIYGNLECRTSFVVSEVSPITGLHQFWDLASVFVAHRTASQYCWHWMLQRSEAYGLLPPLCVSKLKHP